MDYTNEIIGKRLMAVNYHTSFEGYDDYSNDPKADFDYIPLGALHFKLSNGSSYCIADYNSTKLGISGVGIRKICGEQIDLTQERIQDQIKNRWKDLVGQEIKHLYFYINKEDWDNYLHNEFYPESLEIEFRNGKSVFYFCGDVDYFNDSQNCYDLIRGRDSGIIFFDISSFKKYGLLKVQKIEKY